MTRQEYYSRFYDWAESTQLSRISSLTDFGDIREICEIAENFMNEKGASRLVRKALSQNYRLYYEEEKRRKTARAYCNTYPRQRYRESLSYESL